jgi:hypothetical protein
MFKKLGNQPLSDKDEQELGTIIQKMGKIYGSSKVCVQSRECLNLEPGLKKIMADSTDFDERAFVWKA